MKKTSPKKKKSLKGLNQKSVSRNKNFLNNPLFIFVSLLLIVIVAVPIWINKASTTTTLNLSVTAGVLSVDIVDSSRVSVSSPSVSFSSVTAAFGCGTGTATLGTTSQRIEVSNPGAGGANGWAIAIAASAATALWTGTGGTPPKYDFNDAGGSGCTDGADTDTYAGQLTVDPSVSTVTTDYSGSSTTGITKGSSFAFAEGTRNSITLLSADNTAPSVWRGYQTGISLSQTIPAEQTVDTYSLPLTITINTL